MMGAKCMENMDEKNKNLLKKIKTKMAGVAKKTKN